MARPVETAWHEFASPEELAEALAGTVAEHLAGAVKSRGHATLAVSGGSTPARFFRALSAKALAWDDVTIALVDERFVGADSERSNERLVRETLLQGPASNASFAGLFSADSDPDEAAASAGRKIAGLPLPFDVVVLGMGLDGHTASFFPDAENLDALLDPSQTRVVMPVTAPSAGEPRLTLTLPILESARFLALHIEGEAKRDVLDAALSDARPAAPVRRVLDAAASPPQIYWTA